jgi:hypothetical protein
MKTNKIAGTHNRKNSTQSNRLRADMEIPGKKFFPAPPVRAKIIEATIPR